MKSDPWPTFKRAALVTAFVLNLPTLSVVGIIGERLQIGLLMPWAIMHGSFFILIPLVFALEYWLLYKVFAGFWRKRADGG